MEFIIKTLWTLFYAPENKTKVISRIPLRSRQDRYFNYSFYWGEGEGLMSDINVREY